MNQPPSISPPISSAKPRLFIGCAKEDLRVAKAIEQNLWREAEITIWDEDKFDSTHAPIETLLKLSKETDFAVLILSPLDPSRDGKAKLVRDNVIFEAGLFLGALDRDRVFLVKPHHSAPLQLPSNLSGLAPIPYQDDRGDNNWMAAVSPVCIHISSRITALQEKPKQSAVPCRKEAAEKSSPLSDETDSPLEQERKALAEHGIVIGKFSAIGIPSTSTTAFFHEYRFTQAFPGVRGVLWIDDPQEIIDRLKVLLAPPLSFYEAEDEGGVSGWDPIWWWRGRGTNPIDSFEIIGNGKVLLDYQELLPHRLAAVNNGAYYQSYVYIEFAADRPTGLNDWTAEALERFCDTFGYASEEFGLFDGKFVRRAEYDDGAAVINGKLVDMKGRALLRVRYLTPYNLVIAPKGSPINNSRFDNELNSLMNKLAKDENVFDELVNKIRALPRRHGFPD